MPTDNGATFIEKIRAKRVYADCPISSDNSDKSPRSSTGESREDMPTQGGSAGTNYSRNEPTTRNSTGKNRDRSKRKESNEDRQFETMVADHHNNSEEENDKINPCIDFTNSNFKLPVGKEQTLVNCEHPDKIADLPCDIFFLNEKTILQKFETFDQLSGYLVHASVHAKDESDKERDHFQKLVQLPLRHAEHLITLGEYISRLYEDEHLIDVEIVVQGKTFYAHRAALCCSSGYFSTFFDRNTSTKVPFELKIKGVTIDAFAAFLEFCYTGEITVFPETAADIIVMAEFLKVDPLRDRCDEVANSLPLDQSLKMLVKTKSRSQGKLYNVLLSKVLGEFKAASVLEIFFKVDVDLLCRLLESDELTAASEFEVFTIAIRWIVHDVESRVKYTMRILSLVRFYCMTQLELLMCGETTSLVRGYDKFREMILVANWMKTTDSLERDDPFMFPRPKPRLCFLNQAETVTKSEHTPEQASGLTLMMPPPVMTSTPKATPKKKVLAPNENDNASDCVDIFVVGGFIADDNKQQSKFVEKYDIVDNQWLHFSGLPAPTRRHAVVCLDNHLYLIGGSEPCNKDVSPVPRNTVFRMDMDTKRWTQVSDMNVYRHSHCACALNGYIYVIGGKGKYDSMLLSVECYDPETEGWYFVPSLPEPLFGASAANLGSRMFVAGGVGANKSNPSALHVLNSVYSYNTTSNGWTKLHPLRFPRCLSSLVNVNDKLLLCGGATRTYDAKNSLLSSISAIDKYDADEDEWHHVTDMVIPRHDFGAAVAGGRIYMIGGISSPPDRVLQSIECYDTTTLSWVSGLQDLPNPARWICCCSLPSKTRRSKSGV